MVLKQQYINADKFYELIQQPEYENRLVELVEGEIIEISKPTGEHGEITMLLSVKLANHIYENKLGRITAAETGFILGRKPDGKDTVRGLDIAFISKEKAPEPLARKLIDIAPDLVVEVISPGNLAGDIHKKIRELLKVGTQLIWIVYSETKTVVVHTQSGAITLEETDLLSGGNVLPGFEIQVADIFPA